MLRFAGIIIHRRQKGADMGAIEMPKWVCVCAILGAGNEWAYLDGSLHEALGPTKGEMRNFDGETQKIGFAEFAGNTYVEVSGGVRSMWIPT